MFNGLDIDNLNFRVRAATADQFFIIFFVITVGTSSVIVGLAYRVDDYTVTGFYRAVFAVPKRFGGLVVANLGERQAKHHREWIPVGFGCLPGVSPERCLLR